MAIVDIKYLVVPRSSEPYQQPPLPGFRLTKIGRERLFIEWEKAAAVQSRHCTGRAMRVPEPGDYYRFTLRKGIRVHSKTFDKKYLQDRAQHV